MSRKDWAKVPERLKAALTADWEGISDGKPTFAKVRDGAGVARTEAWLPISASGASALFRGGYLEIIISGESVGCEDDIRLWLSKGSNGVERIGHDGR